MIIDFHTHVFPHKIADAAMTKLQHQCGVPYYAPATAESLVKTMDACGVDKSVVLNIVTKETQPVSYTHLPSESETASIWRA